MTRIGEAAGTRVSFSHFNAQGASNYGRAPEGTRLIIALPFAIRSMTGLAADLLRLDGTPRTCAPPVVSWRVAQRS